MKFMKNKLCIIALFLVIMLLTLFSGCAFDDNAINGKEDTSNISAETSADTSTDTSADISTDTSTDTSADASADTSADTSTDASADISTDTSADTSADTPSDTSGETDTSTDISDDTIDYSKKENWAYFGEGEGRDVDLFIVCPTVDMGKNGNYNMSLDDEKTKGNFLGALNMERGIYEDVATMYAPYYRQATFPVYSLSDEEAKPYIEIADEDIAAAFEYYMENINRGRPFILAGFSQGSEMVLDLIKKYFSNEEYSEKLIAAYCIGWRITEEDIANYPHLKMAEGEEDTGVIISFNSEAEGVNKSTVVPEGVKTLGINPLNWKTDSTMADKTLNKGACFTNYSGEITTETQNFCSAYLDENRGTLKLPDVDIEKYSSSMFDKGVYHLYDYQFFFRNLQENVAKRTENYLSEK